MRSSTTSIEFVDDVPDVLYEFTPEQVKVLEESRRRLNFTPEELAAFEERQRRSAAAFERMAATTTLEQQQQRLGEQLWAEMVEQPRAARRIRQARRVAPSPSRPTRPARASNIGRAKAAVRTSTPSRGDPDDDPEPGQLELFPPGRRLYDRDEIRAWIAERLEALAQMGGRR
jgi:hypothetical protein